MDEGAEEARPKHVQEGEDVDEVEVDGVAEGVEEEDDDQRHGQLRLVYVEFKLGLERGLGIRRGRRRNVVEKRLGG